MKKLLIATLIGLIYTGTGLALLHLELIEYGLAFFVFLPFILGYVLGKTSNAYTGMLGLIISLAISFTVLIVYEIDGIGCILMAMPLVIVGVAIGMLVKYLRTRNQKGDNSDQLIKESISPFIFFLLFSFFESNYTTTNKSVNEVRSVINLDYSTTQVYETIKAVDTLDVDASFPMRVALPIPRKCVLGKEEVGGIRTCYFDGGRIIERITELEKGAVLKMDVIDYELTGRKWLGFNEAVYTFEALNNGSTKMTRITTYTSELLPRFYWKYFEEKGIEMEHQYVFKNLIKDLKNNYGE